VRKWEERDASPASRAGGDVNEGVGLDVTAEDVKARLLGRRRNVYANREDAYEVTIIKVAAANEKRAGHTTPGHGTLERRPNRRAR
jgi:hypothetical protein